jgi:hypothetical protein
MAFGDFGSESIVSPVWMANEDYTDDIAVPEFEDM